MTILSSLTNKINNIIIDGRIIDLNFKFNKVQYSIYFRDSYLLLPA